MSYIWNTIVSLASMAAQALLYVVAATIDLLQWIWGLIVLEPKDPVPPQIDGFTPKHGKVGSEVTLNGSGLHGATVTFGGVEANVKSKPAGQLVVSVPENAPGEYAIVAEDGGKESTAPDKFRVLSASAFTFRGGLIFHGATILNSIVPSSLNQKYLVLMVKPTDVAIPAGATAQSLKNDLQGKLEKASNFWLEASYGKTSFTFEIFADVLELNNKIEKYYSTPKTIDGPDVYPVTFNGGEKLVASGDDNFNNAQVIFIVGTKDLTDVVKEINDAFIAVKPNPPIKATTFNGGLRLRTAAHGADAKLELAPASSALTMLGLDPSHSTTTPGKWADDRPGLITDALTKRVANMTDAGAETFLSGFSGVMVAVVADDPQVNWPRVLHASQIEVRKKFYEFSGVVMVTGIGWQGLAHEIGHNLGFPDLYKQIATWPETEPSGRWDIMGGGWNDAHPSTWIKNYMTLDPKDPSKQWLPDSEIEDLPQATDMAASSVEVLLLPIESKFPTTNPFELSHPGVPLRHAIRIKLDENRALLVENRQPGPYDNPKLGKASFSTDLHVLTGGIIVTDAINKFPGTGIAPRSPVVMASPMDDSAMTFPDALGEEVTVFQISPNAAIKVKIIEVIGAAPIVYKVRATWGVGAWVDPYITPWNEPTCDTPDIWVDTELDNAWDKYTHTDPGQNPNVPGNPIENGDRLRKYFTARLYARIRNGGSTIANNVKVNFFVVNPPGIGPTPEELIGSTTVNVPGKGFAVAMVPWTPQKKDEKHACIKVSFDPYPGELNPPNNVAQENFTDWYIEAASPYEPEGFEYQMTNPLPHRALVRMEARGLKPGWFLDVDPLEAWLEPGQTIIGYAAIGASDDVPFEDQDAVNGRPRISLVGRVQQGCTMVAFGGISGIAHAARKAEISGTVTIPNDTTASISANAKTKDGPVNNTNVTVVLLSPDGDQLFMTQIDTNSAGDISVSLPKPENFPPGSEFMVDLLLSPSLGRSPAETRLTFNFPFTAPVADFWATPEFGTAPMTVQFSDNSSGEITSRSWAFGDGADGSELNPTHVYEFQGSFNVTLTVSGPNGSSSAEKMIIVNPQDPVGGGGKPF